MHRVLQSDCWELPERQRGDTQPFCVSHVVIYVNTVSIKLTLRSVLYKHFCNLCVVVSEVTECAGTSNKDKDSRQRDKTSLNVSLPNQHAVWYLHVCHVCVLPQAFQYPASVWRPAESDFKMLQGEHRKDSVLLEHRLSLHAVCGQRQESKTSDLSHC